MNYIIKYICLSHPGKCRIINQDSFVIGNVYPEKDGVALPPGLSGSTAVGAPAVFGVFDGLGGEHCGEVASHIAAVGMSRLDTAGNVKNNTAECFGRINREICARAAELNVPSMGTTAAAAVFMKDSFIAANIGDSRIYRFRSGQLRLLSADHTGFAPFGVKPPLSQCLGIPESELTLEPGFADCDIKYGDVILLCTDGLTDMIDDARISRILSSGSMQDKGMALIQTALDSGGKDNITFILCTIQRKKLFGG